MDEVLQTYSDALQAISARHTLTCKETADRFETVRQDAEEKLAAAKLEYERTMRTAQRDLQKADNEAKSVKLVNELTALQDFDTAMRLAVHAPAGAQMIQVGSQLELYLGDGRAPIAFATPIGSGVWSVDGAGETVMCGSAAQARTELWMRCRPVPAIKGAWGQ